MSKKNNLYPSVFKMISNFTKEVGTYIANGSPNVSPEDYQKRLETCLACPSLKRNVMRCTTCGCEMEYKAKWKTADCPENKWKPQYNEKK